MQWLARGRHIVILWSVHVDKCPERLLEYTLQSCSTKYNSLFLDSNRQYVIFPHCPTLFPTPWIIIMHQYTVKHVESIILVAALVGVSWGPLPPESGSNHKMNRERGAISFQAPAIAPQKIHPWGFSGGEHYSAAWFIFWRTEGKTVCIGLGSVYNVITDPSVLFVPPGHPAFAGIAARLFQVYHNFIF